jgi:hypothetical protein
MHPQNSPTSSRPPGESDLGGSISQAGDAIANKAGDAIANTTNSLKQTARDTAAKVKSAVSDTASRAKEEAGRVASEKKGMAADRIGNYSAAIHDSARSLEEKDPNIAWITHRTADKISEVAEYLRTRDLSGLRQDAEGMARRHPGVFFGGMFLAGLVLGNVVKASRRKVEGDSDLQPKTDEDNGSGYASNYSDQPGAASAGLNQTSPSVGGL